MYIFITVLATAYVVITILRLYGVFEINTQPSSVANEIKNSRDLRKKRKREEAKLDIYRRFAHMFSGLLLTPQVIEDHKFYIQRIGISTKYLNRLQTVEEVRGKHALFFMASLFAIVPGVAIHPIFFAISAVGAVQFFLYTSNYKRQILEEDEIIDNYFIDLYLLLFSKLRRGSRARLNSTIENYIHTLEAQAKTIEVEVMLKFARYFLNLLQMEEDHKAVPKLRNLYNSATVINFCNIASQSLQGVDNFDNLISFKMQLVERKTNLMRIRAQKILRSGERSIYAIWIILFIFIAVGWWSKLPTGFF